MTLQQLQQAYEYKKHIITTLKDPKAIERHEYDMFEIEARMFLIEGE